MLPRSAKAVVKMVGGNPSPATTLLGCLLALVVPVLALLLGGVVQILGHIRETGDVTRLAAFLPNAAELLPEGLSPLAQVTALLAIGALLTAFIALLTLGFYRLIQASAVHFEAAMIVRLRDHARRLATVRTLSAQQTALLDCLDYHLPRVRSTLSRWWRTFPRHLVQLVICFVVAALIQPMLALLTLIATALVTLVYRMLDRFRRTGLPVVRERAAQERETLVDLSLKGPLLDSVHDEAEVEKRFHDQLIHYRKDAFRSLSSSTWKTPALIAASGVLVSLFVFVVAVQVLRAESSFSIAGAFAFSLCIGAASVSGLRLQRALRELRTVESAAEELQRFLELRVEEFDDEELEAIEAVREEATLDHVTLQDSRGRKLLEDVSVVFRPGQLIGVVASQRLQAHALVELLMGLGRPVSGRMLVDGKLVTDIQPESLKRCAHWVASDGAIVTGSVKDNLLGDNSAANEVSQKAVDLQDVVHSSRLVETVQQLPEGLSTIITPGDDRLSGDSPFRIGVARARMRNASVVIIEEPEARTDATVEQQSLEAIRSLVSHDAITVVLPQRLTTLRQCDVVVMVHDYRVSDSGTHADLLQRNELYRHLNYLRFNPFRGA